MTDAKLDAQDKKILEALYRNGRAQIKEISKKTHIQRDSVNYRIKRMERDGVLKFFTPVLDPAKMGHPIFTYVNFVMRSFTREEEARFVAFIKSHPKIVYGARLTGKHHYIIAIAARDLQHFDAVLKEILTKFSDQIKEYDASSIIEEFKYDSFYGLID